MVYVRCILSAASIGKARDQAEQFLCLAQRQGDVAPLLMAHRLLGLPLYFMGEVAQAHEHFVQSVALYDPQQHRALAFTYGQDPGVAALVLDACALWILGYPDQAMRRSHEACTRAEDLAHPFTLAYTFALLAMFHVSSPFYGTRPPCRVKEDHYGNPATSATTVCPRAGDARGVARLSSHHPGAEVQWPVTRAAP